MADHDQLIAAYKRGSFPMADAHDGKRLFWYTPAERGVFEPNEFHVPHGMKKMLKHHPYEITADQDFAGVMQGCAELVDKKDREGTWINPQIHALYNELHERGEAHSVEVWEKAPSEPGGRRLVGGLYGVSLGGVFYGESMFSRAPGTSKLALVHLVDVLREAGYDLLDAQYMNDHLLQFGIKPMPKAEFLDRLHATLETPDNASARFTEAAATIAAAKRNRAAALDHKI